MGKYFTFGPTSTFSSDAAVRTNPCQAILKYVLEDALDTYEAKLEQVREELRQGDIAAPRKRAMIRTPELRPYQIAAIERLNATRAASRRCVLMAAPCGGGKTVIASAIVHDATVSGMRSMFMVHRRELVHQANRKLFQHGIDAGNHRGRIFARAPSTGTGRINRDFACACDPHLHDRVAAC